MSNLFGSNKEEQGPPAMLMARIRRFKVSLGEPMVNVRGPIFFKALLDVMKPLIMDSKWIQYHFMLMSRVYEDYLKDESGTFNARQASDEVQLLEDTINVQYGTLNPFENNGGIVNSVKNNPYIKELKDIIEFFKEVK